MASQVSEAVALHHSALKDAISAFPDIIRHPVHPELELHFNRAIDQMAYLLETAA